MSGLNLAEIKPDFDELTVVERADPTIQEIALGITAEITGDALSYSRILGGIVIAKYIERTPRYRSWPLAIGFSALASTDYLDGKLSRFGRGLRQGHDRDALGIIGSYSDKLSDKFLVDVVGGAIAGREYQNDNPIYATTIAMATGTFVGRDTLTTVDSIIADFQGIKTNARPMGKMKTVLQKTTIAVALSPPAEKPLIRAGVGVAFLGNAALSVASGLDLHSNFQEQRELRRDMASLELLSE